MNKILLVKTSSLGDIVHTYPVISYLKKKFPKAQIDWVVEAPFAELVSSHPFVDRVLKVSTKQWRKNIFNRNTWQSLLDFRKQLQYEQYDVIFDLQGNFKSGLITGLANGRHKVGFGKESVSEWPNLFFTNHHVNLFLKENIRHDYLSLAVSFFKDPLPNESNHVILKISQEEQAILDTLHKNNKPSNSPLVIVCPGSAWPNKQLSSTTLATFLKLLQDDMNCYFFFVWGSHEEKRVAECLQKEFSLCSHLVTKMTLPLLQNMMEKSDLVIAMDSLPLHLAGTTKTPSFSVFGASSAAKYKPLGVNHHAFQGNCPYGRTFVKRCPILRTCLTGACIRDLQAHEIFESLKSWWMGLK